MDVLMLFCRDIGKLCAVVSAAVHNANNAHNASFRIRDIENAEIIHRHAAQTARTPWLSAIQLIPLRHFVQCADAFLKPFELTVCVLYGS